MGNAFIEIAAGIADAAMHAQGRESGVLEHASEPIDVRAIRSKTGLSQQQFCAAFGISLGTLRNWEQGVRAPRGPARALLRVVSREPAAVMRALQEADYQ
jgi:putative transcriptional regulator